MYIQNPSRFSPFTNKIWLSSPTMHGEELQFISQAYESNWMSTFGENLKAVEAELARFIGCRYAVALNCGTSSIHLAIRLAGHRIYGQPKAYEGSLRGHKVFCSDLTFSATANPIAYENGEAVFIDAERDTWNMDPVALERAFACYPDVRLIVLAYLYGTPGKIDEIRAIAQKHNALIVEDAAESLGAVYKGKQAGSFGDFCCISFNGNKIITGSSGGMFLTDSKEDAERIRKWSTQSREDVAWYEHEALGYNYRMSNVIAGVVRGQLPYLQEHIAQKRAVYQRYKEGFSDLSFLHMNPYDEQNSVPNFWLSCLLIDPDRMTPQTRTGTNTHYTPKHGMSCPSEIYQILVEHNVQSRPIWKPMHLQPIYSDRPFISAAEGQDVGADIFSRGLCLPSDNKMTPSDQERLIQIVRACFA